MSRFHNALYLGDVAARVHTLVEVGLCKSFECQTSEAMLTWFGRPSGLCYRQDERPR